VRRTRFEIEQDILLQDRIANLQKLVKDPETSPADREKFHRQLSATRARQTRLRREREDKRRQRQIEQAQEQSKKLRQKHANPDVPADHDHPERTPEEIAALPESLRELFYGIKPEPVPVEIEPQFLPEPEPVQLRRSSFDPIMPEPQDAEKALRWSHRLMMSWNGTASFYQLANGQIVNAEGFPFLGRMAVIAGRRMLSDGTPATLYDPDVIEEPIPGAVFWHGAYFSPEDKQHILEALNKSWQLPALTPDDIGPFPAIAVTHEEAALNNEIRAEVIRYALRPEAVCGY
jgi:hypothetical protein